MGLPAGPLDRRITRLEELAIRQQASIAFLAVALAASLRGHASEEKLKLMREHMIAGTLGSTCPEAGILGIEETADLLLSTIEQLKKLDPPDKPG